MSNNVQVNYTPFKDKIGTEYMIITNVESEKYISEFIIPEEIEGKRVVLLDNESLINLKTSLVVIPEAITLGRNVFAPDLETLFLSDGIIPEHIDLALSSKNTEIFFPYICPEYIRLDRLGYKVSCATMPIYTIVPNNAKKIAKSKDKERERDTQVLTLARTFFDRGISAHLENRPIDEPEENVDNDIPEIIDEEISNDVEIDIDDIPDIDMEDIPDIDEFSEENFDVSEMTSEEDLGIDFDSPNDGQISFLSQIEEDSEKSR